MRAGVLSFIAVWLSCAGFANAATPAPLTYAPAKRAFQAKADRVAGQRTEIKSMFHLKPTVYSGQAEWRQVNPTGCAGCGYDPATESFYDTPTTEVCSLSMIAKKLASGRIRVRIDGSYCL